MCGKPVLLFAIARLLETEPRAFVSECQIEEGEFGERTCATAKQPRGAAAQNGNPPILEADHVSERLEPSHRVEHHACLDLTWQADDLEEASLYAGEDRQRTRRAGQSRLGAQQLSGRARC